MAASAGVGGMKKRFNPKIITSNDLILGDAIYLAEDGSWSRRFEDARVFVEPDEADAALSLADQRQDLHVGAYLADAAEGSDGRPRPAHFRERFRATGPSVYFHGKQAEI